MARTNPARNPKRIRRWLQTTAAGTVLVSSGLFGLIAVQGANATAHEAGAVVPVATPWTWPSARNAAVLTQTPGAPEGTGAPVTRGAVVAASTPTAASAPVISNTVLPANASPATPTPTVRARTRAS